MIEINSPAPGFTLQDKNGEAVTLQDFKGKWVVIYFYPKDNTPGCTTEACEFSAKVDDFSALDAVVLGVSADSVDRHKGFSDKHSLQINLLSDPDKRMLEDYGAWRMKKNFGKEYMGIVRATYLINPEGNVAFTWDKVKVKGHVEAVATKLAELRGS